MENDDYKQKQKNQKTFFFAVNTSTQNVCAITPKTLNT